MTRAASSAQPLVDALRQQGFEPVAVPLLERVAESRNIADAVHRHPSPTWVLTTSPFAAQAVFSVEPDAWPDARWAAVGPATAQALVRGERTPALVADTHTAAHLVREMADLSGALVVCPRSELASPEPLAALRDAGATAIDIVAYRNRQPTGAKEAIGHCLPVDFTTLFSGSAANRLADVVPENERHRLGRVISVGPTTTRIATDVGLRVASQADPHDTSGVLAALQKLRRASTP